MVYEPPFTPYGPRFLRFAMALALCVCQLPVSSALASSLSLTPDKGPTAGGTRVLVEIDDGLTLGGVRVKFGGRSVPVVRGLGLSIVEVIAPPGDPGPVSVLVEYGLLGKSTASASFRYVPPTPRLTRLEPPGASTGSEELALSVEGEDFSTVSSVRVGEMQVPTSVLSAQRIQARIPASLLARPGVLQVQVTDAVGGSPSNVVPLTVANPPPQLTAVEAPPLRASGSAGPPANTPGPATITARGRSFRRESVIQVAGTAVPTQYHSDQELTAMIPPEMLAKSRELPIIVMTPGPGGGTSRPLSLAVMAPFPGRFLVFTSNRHGQRNHIYLLDRQTGRLDPLEEANSRNNEDSYPSISADGRFIAFQSDRHGGQFHVFLFDRETRTLDPLPELNHATAFDGFPRISSDGRFIVFESDRLYGRPKVFLFDRQARTLSELIQANEPAADDGLAAISD